MLAKTVILLVRHAEKPGDPCLKDTEGDTELSPAGLKRSERYVSYFEPITLTSNKGEGSLTFRPDYLVAAADTVESHRPKLTLEPLHAANPSVPYIHNIASRHIDRIRKTLKDDAYDGKCVLICWHHGEIIALANALLAPHVNPPPKNPPPGLPASANWPSHHPCQVFGWIYQIVYDADGAPDLDWVRCLNEKLMPDDTVDPPG